MIKISRTVNIPNLFSDISTYPLPVFRLRCIRQPLFENKIAYIMSHKTDLYSLDIKQHKKRLKLHESQSPIFSNYYPLLSFSSLNQCWPCARPHGYTDTECLYRLSADRKEGHIHLHGLSSHQFFTPLVRLECSGIQLIMCTVHYPLSCRRHHCKCLRLDR